MTNTIIITNTFDRLYKKKKSSHEPEYIISKIKEIIENLMSADDPKSLGELKKGELYGYYACEINSDSRLLYSVEKKDNHTFVNLLRVCNHKKAYKKG